MKKLQKQLALFCQNNKLNIFVISFFFLVVLTQYIRTWGFFMDDGFIGIQYAKNILNGNGWVFSLGEHYNSSTTTLLIFQHTILGFIFGIKNLEIIAYSTFYIWVLIIAVFAWLYLKNHINKFLAFSAALSLVISHHFYFSYGIDATMNIGLIFISLWAYDKKYIKLMLTSFALLLLTRLENGLFVTLFFVYLYFIEKISFKKLIRYGVFVAMPLLLWFIFSYFYFGSIFPQSLSAKLWQGKGNYYWGSGHIFLRGLFGYVNFFSHPWRQVSQIHIPVWHASLVDDFNFLKAHKFFASILLINWFLILYGIFSTLRKKSNSLVIFLMFWIIHTFVYGFIFNVPLYPWYASLSLVSLFIFTNIGIEAFVKKEKKFLIFCCLFFLIPLLIEFAKPVDSTVKDGRTQPYRELAAWIKENTPENATILHEEIGEIAYLSNRRTLDTLALTSPQYLNYLKKKNYRFWIDYIEQDYYFVSYQNIYPMDKKFMDPMLVYQRDGFPELKLFKLDPERFITTDSQNQKSILALDYDLVGPEERTGYERRLLIPDNKMCNSIAIHAQNSTEQATILRINEIPKGYDKLSFYALLPTEAIELGSNGLNIKILVYYKNDKNIKEYNYDFNPNISSNYTLIQLKLDQLENIDKIEIKPYDENNAYDWFQICRPVFEN